MGLLNARALSETVVLANYLFLTATAFIQPFLCRVFSGPHLGRFQNHVRILNRVACPDQSNRQWYSLFELRVRLKRNRNRVETLVEAVHRIQTISTAEFFRHHDLPNHEVSLDRPEDFQNARNIVDKRYIYGFDLRPVRKSPVGDDQRVCVTDAA
jgi:hypothetical protein